MSQGTQSIDRAAQVLVHVLETEEHPLVTVSRTVPEGSEHQVPDGEDSPEVAVGLRLPCGMMDAVQIGRHDHAAEDTVDGGRQADV